MTAGPLLRLLDHLAAAPPAEREAWQGWQISRIGGGHNGVVYRATGEAGDLAVKLTRRDERDRAGREYSALCALLAVTGESAYSAVLLAHGP